MSDEITNGTQSVPDQPQETQTEAVETQEQKFSVDFAETSEAAKEMYEGVKEKETLSEKGAEKTTTPKYKTEKDYAGDTFWTDTTTGERLYDEPEDVTATVEGVSDEAQRIFTEAINEADKQIAGKRQTAIDAAQKALATAASQAFDTLDENKRKILTNDILNSQMPGIIAAIDNGNVNWDEVSVNVANEIEQRIDLYNLREQEQEKIDADKRANFPLETRNLTGIQGFEGAKSRMNATRAEDETFVQQLAKKLQPLLRGK